MRNSTLLYRSVLLWIALQARNLNENLKKKSLTKTINHRSELIFCWFNMQHNVGVGTKLSSDGPFDGGGMLMGIGELEVAW